MESFVWFGPKDFESGYLGPYKRQAALLYWILVAIDELCTTLSRGADANWACGVLAGPTETPAPGVV